MFYWFTQQTGAFFSELPQGNLLDHVHMHIQASLSLLPCTGISLHTRSILHQAHRGKSVRLGLSSTLNLGRSSSHTTSFVGRPAGFDQYAKGNIAIGVATDGVHGMDGDRRVADTRLDLSKDNSSYAQERMPLTGALNEPITTGSQLEHPLE